MARPKFDVQHFIICRAAPWEGLAGPHTPRTLEGVSHRYSVPPDAEFPFEVEELWFYLRLFPRNNAAGTVPLTVDLVWHGALGNPQDVWSRLFAQVHFRPGQSVIDAAYSVRAVSFPGAGWYEFRLHRDLRLAWGNTRRVIAREHVLIEK